MRMNRDPTVHGYVSNEGLFYDSLEITTLMVERVFIEAALRPTCSAPRCTTFESLLMDRTQEQCYNSGLTKSIGLIEIT
jgi:hypothetical protein